jgi:hypothetical protein
LSGNGREIRELSLFGLFSRFRSFALFFANEVAPKVAPEVASNILALFANFNYGKKIEQERRQRSGKELRIGTKT